MTVSCLKASPTQASDNKQINALCLFPLRIKVEDVEDNEEEEWVEETLENPVFWKESELMEENSIRVYKKVCIKNTRVRKE